MTYLFLANRALLRKEMDGVYGKSRWVGHGWLPKLSVLSVLEPAELRLRPSLLLDRLSVPRSIGSAVRPDTFLKWDDLRGIQAPHSPASLTKASSAAGQLKRMSSRVSIAHVVPNFKI